MTSVQKQKQLFADAQRLTGECNAIFLDMVRDGLTREELQRNIDRRPELWSRYERYLPQLPTHAEAAADWNKQANEAYDEGDMARVAYCQGNARHHAHKAREQ